MMHRIDVVEAVLTALEGQPQRFVAKAVLEALDRNAGEPRSRLGLTGRQRQCLDFIEQFVASNGYSPSFDEIAAALGLSSKSVVSRMLSSMAARGYIELPRHRSRGVRVIAGVRA